MYIYLASPYSDPDPSVRSFRYSENVRIVGNLIREGYIVYSPIVHFHMVALQNDLPKGFSFWENINKAMISRAEKLTVLKLPEWDQSLGVQEELAYAQTLRLPIDYYDWQPDSYDPTMRLERT